MTVLIDYINDTPDTIKQKFNSIQKRLFDPFSIRLTTDTNKYVFIDDVLSYYSTQFFGNNKVIYGLKATNINLDTTNNIIQITFEPGLIISDSVLIEFTSDFTIKQHINSIIDINNVEDNYIYVVYNNVKTYPPNVANIKVGSKTYIETYEDVNTVNGVIARFKADNTNIVEYFPDYEITGGDPEYITLFNKQYQISPYHTIQAKNQGIFDSIKSIYDETFKSIILSLGTINQTLLNHEEKILINQYRTDSIFKPKVVNTDYTQNIGEGTFLVDTTNNNVTIHLNKEAKYATIKKISNDTNEVYISPDIGKIDNNDYLIITNQYDSYTVVFDETTNNWYIV